MKRMSQNANPSIAISGMFNKSIIRSNTTQTLMNISGMDYPDQVVNNHLADPVYIRIVDALLYCQNKRTMCTTLIKLTVIMYLFCCPPTGIISQRTSLYDCVPTRVTLGTPASLWTAMRGAHHWIPKNEVLNVRHHAGNRHRQSGGDKGGMARLQDTQSASLKHKSQQVANALSSVHLQQPAPHSAYPFSGAIPLQSHHSFTPMLCLGFEVEFLTCLN